MTTDIIVYFSDFAKYDYTQISECSPKHASIIDEIIKTLKRLRLQNIPSSFRRKHTLTQNNNFPDLQAFQSFDVDKKQGWRFICKEVYLSYRDSDRNYITQEELVSTLPYDDNIKQKIWKCIVDCENNCTSEAFSFVYVAFACFSPHIGESDDLSKCSIDYLRREVGLPENDHSPYKNTRYSVHKLTDSSTLLTKIIQIVQQLV